MLFMQIFFSTEFAPFDHEEPYFAVWSLRKSMQGGSTNIFITNGEASVSPFRL